MPQRLVDDGAQLLDTRDPADFAGTHVRGSVNVGLGGSFLAGLFSWYVLKWHGAGLVLSVLFAMLILWFMRRSGRRM